MDETDPTIPLSDRVLARGKLKSDKPEASRTEQCARLLIKHGWRCHWSMPSLKDFTNPFVIECWAKGGRICMVQAWKDGNGVSTYFLGGGETWEQLEVELARDAAVCPSQQLVPMKELHAGLDILSACFLTENKSKMPHTTTLKELMDWTHQEAIKEVTGKYE